MPAWQKDGNPGLDRLRAALGDRPYTAFAGHCHNYQRTVFDGRDHIRLGPTGGVRILDTDDGDWDHITTVTVTADGPRIANIVLDGVIGVEGGVFKPSRRPLDLISR
jgi:serine/threonine-protein phosphatase CPPED1